MLSLTRAYSTRATHSTTRSDWLPPSALILSRSIQHESTESHCIELRYRPKVVRGTSRWFKTRSPPTSTGLFVSLGSKVGCAPHMRHQNKGIFNHNNNLEWLLFAFEATRFGGALKSVAANDWIFVCFDFIHGQQSSPWSVCEHSRSKGNLPASVEPHLN